ncbi:MAG: efflux RND transporter periplasmic adaptor subunit [Pseudanabaenaceae cyanobacterium]
MSNLPIPAGKKRWQGWSIAVAVLALGGVGIPLLTQQTRNELPAGITEEIRPQTIKLRIRASGAVVPIRSVNISPKQAGKLVELLVEQGDTVRRGQIIARMDDSGILPQVLQARAGVESARANLARLQNGSRPEEIAAVRARVASARARLELAQRRRERTQFLASEGAVARDRLDEALTEERTAKALLEEAQRQLQQLENGARSEDIAQAQAQLLQAEASLRAAEVQLEDTVIRSPLNGIVAQRYTNAGAFVAPQVSPSTANSSTSAAIVAIAEGLEILARVPEVDIAQIKVGQPVEIIADAFPTKTFKGRVRLIAPEAVIEQNVTSFQVRITLETGQDILRSGMNTDLRFLGDTITNAITVPTVAIVTENGQTGVLVADANNRPQFRPVTLGNTVDDRTQILTGLSAGDRVFLTNPQ